MPFPRAGEGLVGLLRRSRKRVTIWLLDSKGESFLDGFMLFFTFAELALDVCIALCW